MGFWRGVIVLSVAALLFGLPYNYAGDPSAATHDLEGPVEILWSATRTAQPACKGLGVAGVVASTDGEFVIVTGTEILDQGSNLLTMAYDARTGTERWLNRFGGQEDRVYGYDIALSPDDRLAYVTARFGGPELETNFDYLTIAIDTRDGTTVWQNQQDGGTFNSDQPRTLAVSPDGRTVIVAGESLEWGRDNDLLTLALDAETGTTLWRARYEDRTDVPWTKRKISVAVSERDQIAFVRCASPNPFRQPITEYNWITVAYGLATGAQLWDVVYDGPTIYDDLPGAMALGASGSTLVVTGSSVQSDTGHDVLTAAYAPDSGLEIWNRTHHGPFAFFDIGSDVAVDPSSAVAYVAGTETRHYSDQSWPYLPPKQRMNHIVMAHDVRSGDFLWKRSVVAPWACSTDRIVSNPDWDTLYVGGVWTPWPWLVPQESVTMALDARSGNLVWMARLSWSPAEPDSRLVDTAAGANDFAVFRAGKVGQSVVTIAYATILAVAVDVLPMTIPNVIDLERPGVVPVTLLGSEDLDVRIVDASTLRFGPAEAKPNVRANDSISDYWPPGMSIQNGFPDINNDGHPDLTVRFLVQETGIQCGDTDATLTGKLNNGRPIRGTDSIVTTGCR